MGLSMFVLYMYILASSLRKTHRNVPNFVSFARAFRQILSQKESLAERLEHAQGRNRTRFQTYVFVCFLGRAAFLFVSRAVPINCEIIHQLLFCLLGTYVIILRTWENAIIILRHAWVSFRRNCAHAFVWLSHKMPEGDVFYFSFSSAAR